MSSKISALPATAFARCNSPRIASHAFQKQVLPRRGLNGARHDYLLQRDDIGIRLADCNDNIDQVGMLVTRMYRQRGYLVPATEANARDAIRRVTLEACCKGQTVGTLSINLDSQHGLNAEVMYREEIARFRCACPRICEFGRLALDASENAKTTLAYLFHIGYIFAYRIYRATDLFIEVNPRHALFYKRKLGFEQVGAEKLCPRVNAPAVLLHKDLAALAEELAIYGGRQTPDNKTFYALWLTPHQENELVATITQVLDASRASPQHRDSTASPFEATENLARSA